MKPVTAIIPAAGSSSRLGNKEIPSKIFLKIGERSVLQHSLTRLLDTELIQHIIIPTRVDLFDLVKEQINGLKLKVSIDIIEGGATRQESVFNSLGYVKEPTSLVLIHDAARPNVSVDAVKKVIEQAELNGGAILAVAAYSTIKKVSSNCLISETLDRDSLYLASTPQVFKFENLLSAHRKALAEQFMATDDAQLMEFNNFPVAVVADQSSNIKLTTMEDYRVLKALMLND